jgi:hypothetical protein
VCKVYADLLGRPVDPAGAAAWTAYLNAGGSRARVVQAILSSPEYRTDRVASFYQAILGRAPDPSGLALASAELAAGASDEVVEADLFGSTEYFTTRGGSTGKQFILALYRDVLGREADADGLAFWEAQIESGESRTAIALALLQSGERFGDLVAADYVQFLHRPADSTGLATWTFALLAGRTDESVITALLASDEYLALP